MKKLEYIVTVFLNISDNFKKWVNKPTKMTIFICLNIQVIVFLVHLM